MLGADTISSRCDPGLLLPNRWIPVWYTWGPKVSVRICEFKQKWRWACTLTHPHSTGILVKAHTWHSLESHIQICRSPVGDQHWPSACLDPGPHACQLYQPEVCQQMIHTQSVHAPFGVDVDTSSPQQPSPGSWEMTVVLPSLQHWAPHLPHSCWSPLVSVFWNAHPSYPSGKRQRPTSTTVADADEMPLAPVADTTDCGAPAPPVWLQLLAPNLLTPVSPVTGTWSLQDWWDREWNYTER